MYRLTSERAAAAVTTSRMFLFMAALAIASTAIETLTLPTPLRAPFGLLLVLVLPGWALRHAAFPRSQLSLWDGILASTGLSLAVATCSAVLLAALPVGLSRESFAALLGAITVVLVIAATIRGEANERSEGRPMSEESPDINKRLEGGHI